MLARDIIFVVSKSRRSADVSPLSKQTEAANVSNWRPAEAVAVTEAEFVPKVGEDEVEPEEKSNMSSSLLFPLKLLPLPFPPFDELFVGVWTE